MSRGKVGSSTNEPIGSSAGISNKRKQNRGPGVSSLNTRAPPINNSAGSGFNNNLSPYAPSGSGHGNRQNASRQGGNSLGKGNGSSLNTNVFNIPKYG